MHIQNFFFFFYRSFSENALKFLKKSAALSMNSERQDMSSLFDKWMLILKGRFLHFQLSNGHFKGIKIFLGLFLFISKS